MQTPVEKCTGREWLQCDELFEIARSTFFDALKSARRGDVIEALTHRFTTELAETREGVSPIF